MEPRCLRSQSIVPSNLRPQRSKTTRSVGTSSALVSCSAKPTSTNRAKAGNLIQAKLESASPDRQPAKRKKGRQKKKLIQEVVECVSPDLQPAKRKRGSPKENLSIASSELIKDGASADSLETPVDLSSREVTTSGTTKLLKLKPPPKSGNYKTSEEHMEVLKKVVALLVSELTQAPDADQMIDLSVKTFTFLDSIGVRYLPTYEAVHTFISYHCDKEWLEVQKQGPAFLTKARHDELMSTVSEAEQACSRADARVSNAQNKLVPLRARVKEMEEELRKAKNALAEGEAELAAAEADRVHIDDAHSQAKTEFISISHRMDKDMVVIEAVERRWEEAMAGIRRTKDVLLLFRNFLLSEY